MKKLSKQKIDRKRCRKCCKFYYCESILREINMELMNKEFAVGGVSLLFMFCIIGLVLEKKPLVIIVYLFILFSIGSFSFFLIAIIHAAKRAKGEVFDKCY